MSISQIVATVTGIIERSLSRRRKGEGGDNNDDENLHYAEVPAVGQQSTSDWLAFLHLLIM